MDDSYERRTKRLSKSRFVQGRHCHKRLWWLTHEPGAPELAVDASTQFTFDQGNEVGELARTWFPGGEPIDFPYHAVNEKVAATADALKRGVPAIYEASFVADDVFVAVDVLERTQHGFTLVEVKSSSSKKPEHVPDAAIQAHVLRAAGIDVRRVEVMHLNKECRYPDLSNLFVRTDVTAEVEELLPEFPAEIRAQLAALQGPLPEVEIGDHCHEHHGCPFLDRCWPELPEFHISTLYRIAKKQAQLEADGYVTIHDIPDDFALNAIQGRQRRAVIENRIIVEPALGKALERLKPPIAFLDFETVGLAIPRWPECKPWQSVAAQFSCHVQREDGSVTHHEWIANGPQDPRPELVRQLIRACDGAKTIAVYNVGFERRCMKEMGEAFPEYADALTDISDKLVDLLPIVRNHVYHPDFDGHFGLKYVLPALVPELSYDDLEVAEGQAASAGLVSLMFSADDATRDAQGRIRQNLLEYCRMDTWGLVKTLVSLKKHAGGRG